MKKDSIVQSILFMAVIVGIVWVQTSIIEVVGTMINTMMTAVEGFSEAIIMLAEEIKENREAINAIASKL